MNRQQWKDLLEGIGFVAIIASLIFVGIETRNSTHQAELTTRALEISAYAELQSNIEAFNALGIQSEAGARIQATMWGADDSIDMHEYRVDRMLFILFRHGDTAHFMYEKGAIDEERLRSSLAPLPLQSERALEFWERAKTSFTESYRDYVDRMIVERNAGE